MTTPFAPRLDILPPPQRRLWNQMIGVPDAFTMYGGTAIALQLGHRVSVDFDFFADADIDHRRLLAEVPFLRHAAILQQDNNTLTCLVDLAGPVKVSFFELPNLRTLVPPLIAAGNGDQNRGPARPRRHESLRGAAPGRSRTTSILTPS